MASHRMYFKEVSGYSSDFRDRKYKYIGLQSSMIPCEPQFGEILDFETIGRIIANGHRVIILPAEPNGEIDNSVKETASGFKFA